MEYTEKDLVKIAKRENNTKRNYLVVDPLQGKHIPVVPSKALDLFAALADTFREKYKDEKLLLVGFAETATAIGAQAAITVGADYIQTTREVIPGVNYLFFSEEHRAASSYDNEFFSASIFHLPLSLRYTRYLSAPAALSHVSVTIPSLYAALMFFTIAGLV